MNWMTLFSTCLLIGFGMSVTDTLAAEKKRPMAIEDLYKLKRVGDPRISPDGKWVVYVVTSVDLAANKSSSNLWLVAAEGDSAPRQLTTTDKKDRNPRWSPDGKQILFESTRSGDGQLWVIDLDGGEARQVTTISTGAATGIWSPDGKRIAFVSAVFPEFSEKPFKESDELNKKKLEEIEKSPVKAKVFKRLFYRHWDSYVEDKRQHLFVCNADGSECRDVTPGDRDAYPTSTTFSVGDDFTFSPDGNYLVFTAVPATGEAWSTNHDLCRVSIDNQSTKWESLTGDNPAADGSPRFSPSGKKLAYRAQKKAGYEADKWQLMIVDCNADGTLAGKPRSLTEKLAAEAGNAGTESTELDVSVDEFAWRNDREIWIAFDWRGVKPLARVFLDRVGVLAFASSNLSGSSGGINFSSGGQPAFTVARMDHPAEVFTMKGNDRMPLSKVNDAYLAGIDRPRPESVLVPVEGGASMQMWILKPPGFDSNKKWPVAYLVHGGPQSAWEDGWSFRWNPTTWAARGYVVALPNPRGSTGFGQKFVDDISGDWGGKCYRDLMAGADYLEQLPYVDKDRIGSAGASFGGYMMDWFAVNTGRFKCLITHCSVWNFESMWGTTDELWFDEYEHGGLPWEVPGKYREFSPHIKAGNLGRFKTPMLVIHNDLDFRCPIGQGHELFSALQRQGVPSRFINFPDEGHWVTKPRNGEFWHKEVFAWLTKYVPPGGK